MKQLTPDELYQDGAAFAGEVQEALQQGKTFDDMQAMPPDRAAYVRDLARKGNSPVEPWWDGYVSRWD